MKKLMKNMKGEDCTESGKATQAVEPWMSGFC